MPDTDAKALARELYEALWSDGELEWLDALIGRDYVGHAPGTEPLVGREALGRFVLAWRRGFPDLQVAVGEQLQEDDRVVSRLALRGTHEGRFAGMSPTRRRVDLPIISMLQLQDGRVTGEWLEFDRRCLLEQLGLVPALS
jgi:predicted ester cyclase